MTPKKKPKKRGGGRGGDGCPNGYEFSFGIVYLRTLVLCKKIVCPQLVYRICVPEGGGGVECQLANNQLIDVYQNTCYRPDDVVGGNGSLIHSPPNLHNW